MGNILQINDKLMKDQKRNVLLITLGCPKNEVDSEVMASYLYQWGMEVVGDAREADVILINTCGFIEDAKKESIDAIFETLALKNQGCPKKIYVWGCLAERYKGQIDKMIPEIDGFFGVEPFKDVKDQLCDSSVPFQHNDYSRYFLSKPSCTAYLKIAEGQIWLYAQ